MSNYIILTGAIILGLSLAACSSSRTGQGKEVAGRKPQDSTAIADSKREFNPDEVSHKDIPYALNLRDYLARVPGVVLDGYNVSIRGAGPPLFVVDDVPIGRSLRDAENLVNVYDIDYVEVVKSPSELALYGRLGGNGVIRIFTKRAEQ